MREYDELVAELRQATAPTEAQLARVEAALARRRARAPLRAAAAGIAGAAALAAALLWALQPPAPVDRTLDHTGTVALGPQVTVDSRGEGSVAGSAADMDVAWRRGTLSVEVEPDQGVRMQVHTEEGTVQVVGTGFDVDRGALGTVVNVRHGRVRVDCVRGGVSELGAGESRTCAPVSAAGALRRALALQAVVPPAQLLEELDGALARPDAAGPVAAELLALRAGTLVEAGRRPEAVAAAEQALAHPDVTRAPELHRVAARLLLEGGDCAAALPHLQALAEAGMLQADLPAWERCSGR